MRVLNQGILIAALTLGCPVAVAQSPIASEKASFMKEVIKSPVVVMTPFPAALPLIVPFGDWDYFYITRDLHWYTLSGQDTPDVVVPMGFVSDLASVPSVFWSYLPRTGRYAYAAIVHDYLYWTQMKTKHEADKVLEAAMKDSGVPGTTVTAIMAGVGLGGQSAWDANATLRSRGEKRILKVFPDNRLLSWQDWRKRPGVFAD
jgi:hypothetical protein